MASWGLDLLSKLAESSSLDAVRDDFPRKSDEGLNPSQFLAVMRKHIGQEEFDLSAACGSGDGRHTLKTNCMANKVGEVFKQMDVRGDGDVSWEDFSAYVLQLELLHDGKGVTENELRFKPFGAHLGLDGHIRGGGAARVDFLPAPVEKLGLIAKGNEVVHLIGQGFVPDDDKAAFRVESGGSSDLVRVSGSLRHDTAYRPHEVHAVHSIPGQDIVITSSSLGLHGPHFLTLWDLPTEEERSSEKQFLPAMACREETPTAQTVIYWASTMEMVLTGSSGNGALLGWEIHPLRQCAKLWLHDSGISNVHELIGHAGGSPRLVTASLDGTIAVCGGSSKASTSAAAKGVLQRLQAHERGVARMAFCLQHSISLSAGVFVNTAETTPDILVWRLDRSHGRLAQDIHTRLRGHESQVIGMAFVESAFEVVTGGADAVFLVWYLPSLALKQRFTRSSCSPMTDQSVSSMTVVPKVEGKPTLLISGMLESGGLEIYARVEQKLHEALIKAEFCAHLQRFVTVSGRRATVWDGKTGEALTTLMSERLLGNPQAEITAFSLDHQGHKLVVGADTGDILACASHNGSLIRRLDPHDGPVNWLSFASRKTDKCVFSIGGDGALHVLDDADAKGYMKSTATIWPDRGKAAHCAPQRPSFRTQPGGETGRIRMGNTRQSPLPGPKQATVDLPRASIVGIARASHNTTADLDLGERIPVGTNGGRGNCEENSSANISQAAMSFGTCKGNKGAGNGRSVLLRRVAFSSEDSETEEEEDEDDAGGNDGIDGITGKKSVNDFHPQKCLAGAAASGPGAGHQTLSPQHQQKLYREGSQRGEGVMVQQQQQKVHRKAMQQRGGVAESGSYTDGDGTIAKSVRASQDELKSGGYEFSASSPKSRFVKAARTLMSAAVRNELLEKELSIDMHQDSKVDVLFAKPKHDMTACAADDHLDVIATAATSDGGMENMKTADTSYTLPSAENTQSAGNTSLRNSSSRAGRPSSAIHVWDAEMMTLLGTLLLPCLSLTKDLANAAAAFGMMSTSPRAAANDTATADTTPTDSTGEVAATSETAGVTLTGPSGTGSASVQDSRTVLNSSTAIRGRGGTGTRNSQPVLVTALKFLSPYPLLAGATTGGAVVLWRVTDCVCVQAILLSRDLSTLRGKGRGAGGATAEEEEEHLSCLARGKHILDGGEEVVIVYAGNDRGYILAAHLRPEQLAVLSGDPEGGPVPSRRRANHNPYRAVRVTLTPQKAEISWRAACRTQRKATVATVLAATTLDRGHRDPSSRRARGSTAEGGGSDDFAVPSTVFQVTWAAHSAAVSSVSWIDSPPSLLSASADGLAKIWSIDGGSLLGQLDINNKLPERSLSLEGRQWNFVPGGNTPDSDSQQTATDHSESFAENAVRRDFACKAKRQVSGAQKEGQHVGVEPDEGIFIEESLPQIGVGNGTLNGRPRSPQQQKQQQRKQNEGDDTPVPGLRFPISETGKIGTQTAAKQTEKIPLEPGARRIGGGIAPPLGLGGWRRHARVKPVTGQSTAAAEGINEEETWMSGWNGMARQLREFEQRLEASSSDRQRRVAFRKLGGVTCNSATRIPLRGKKWGTRSGLRPITGQSTLQHSVSDNILNEEGNVGNGGGGVGDGLTKPKGMWGYIRPRPGTAEDLMLKRAQRKGATGMVSKDKTLGHPSPDPLKGRPLQEWLASSRQDENIRSANCGDVMTETLLSDLDTNVNGKPNAARVKTTAPLTTVGGSNGEKGLPPVAVLAGSRGGRLVASGVTIAGDCGGGGFNVKLAKAAAREAARLAAVEGVLGGGSVTGDAAHDRVATAAIRRHSGMIATGAPNGPAKSNGALNGGRARWGWGRGNSSPTRANNSATNLSRRTGRNDRCQQKQGGRHAGEVAVGNVSVSSSNVSFPGGGRHHSSGANVMAASSSAPSGSSCGSRGNSGTADTDGSSGAGPGRTTLGERFVPKAQNSGLAADSVMRAGSSQRRGSRSTPSSRGRREGGAGQGETIRRLVHMGLF